MVQPTLESGGESEEPQTKQTPTRPEMPQTPQTPKQIFVAAQLHIPQNTKPILDRKTAVGLLAKANPRLRLAFSHMLRHESEDPKLARIVRA